MAKLITLQRRAAEGAEAEVGVINRAGAGGAAAEGVGGEGVGDARTRRGEFGREEERAVGAVQGVVLGRPPPDGDEEELQHLVAVDEVGGGGAAEAAAGADLEDLPDLLLNRTCEEEEHG